VQRTSRYLSHIRHAAKTQPWSDAPTLTSGAPHLHAMRRKIRFHPGGYYHIYNRGANRQSIFRERANYEFVQRKMAEISKRYQLSAIAYCLLPNHYHFLARQNGEAPARLLAQYVFNAYTKAYNKRYGHSGTLFEGSYRAIEVYTPVYIQNLVRYIHANPVLHGLVDDPFEWPYSNLHEWVGERQSDLYDPDFVKEHFDGPEAYRRYLLEYMNTRELPKPLASYLKLIDF